MELLNRDLLKIIRKRFHSNVDLRIGQRGLHEKLVDEAKSLLEKRGGIIKVKILRNAALTKEEASDLAMLLAQKINADYVKVVGRSAIIAKIGLVKKSIKDRAIKETA